jgi:tRNA(fMet)-specific endonuclease VapC
VKKVLLDTNAYTALLRGDEKVLSAIGAAESVGVSTIVLGELFAGFRGGNRLKENRQVLDRFLDRPHVALLPVGLETADVFGVVKQQLKAAGSPIPINDVWIAAHAMETGSVLITYDKHFKQVAGLRLWDEI